MDCNIAKLDIYIYIFFYPHNLSDMCCKILHTLTEEIDFSRVDPPFHGSSSSHERFLEYVVLLILRLEGSGWICDRTTFIFTQRIFLFYEKP